MIGELAQSLCSAPVRSAPRGAAAQISSEPRETPAPKWKGGCGVEKTFPGAGSVARLPARCLLSPFPAGWCWCAREGGSGAAARAVPARTGVRDAEECQPLSHGPPPAPAGIKLVLTWAQISLARLPPPLPPPQPLHGHPQDQGAAARGENEANFSAGGARESQQRYVSPPAACPPRGTGS